MKTKEYVEYLLRNYQKLIRDLEFMKYESEYFKGISESEGIEALTFKQPEGERVSSSQISDKTGRISLVFKEYVARMNRESKDSIDAEICALEYETKWVEYSLNRINKKYGDIIRDLYMTEMSWEEVCCKYGICSQTLANYRRNAVKEITLLFERQKRKPAFLTFIADLEKVE